MAEKKQYEYFLLQYAPNAGNPSSITMGIVMYEPGNPEGFAKVRLRRNWDRLRCIDPEVDVDELEAIGRGLEQELSQPERETFLKKVAESFSNLVQAMPVTGLLAEDAAKELDALEKFHMGVAHAAAGRRELTGRQWILGKIKDDLEKAGVLGLMHQRFPVEQFTLPGDPLKLDFAYPVRNEIKFLHAVSLRAGVDQAVILAARFKDVVAGIRTKKNAEARLRVVMEDNLDLNNMEIGFALAMMREKGLSVAAVGQMPTIARDIRLELGA